MVMVLLEKMKNNTIQNIDNFDPKWECVKTNVDRFFPDLDNLMFITISNNRTSGTEVRSPMQVIIMYLSLNQIGQHWWAQCVRLAYSPLPLLIETLSRDLNAGATIQTDHSREIHITRVYTTLHFIITMAAHTL